MNTFLTLEAGTLTIAAFFLGVAIFVATRPFMAPGAFRRIVIPTAIVLAALVGLHYKITSGRMDEVKAAFDDGAEVICENRSTRNGPPSIVISKKLGWTLEGDVFTNPEFSRPFHSARCITH